MSKKPILVLALVLVFAMSAVVFAATAPEIVLDPIGELNFTSFPQIYDITGTATFSDPLIELQLKINGHKHGDHLATIPAPGNVTRVYDFSFPWSITGPGEYIVTVTGRHGNEWGFDEEEVVVIGEITVIVDYPAAPAVAAELLKQAGVKPRYGNGKKAGNYISDVAHEMYPGTDFNGVSKDNVAAYREAVDAFLRAKGAY